MVEPVDVLVIAAHPLELEPLRAALGADLRGELSGLRVVAASVGVGLYAAGAGTARALAAEQPRAAVLVGSYGLYPGRDDFVPGRLLVPSRYCAVDMAALSGKAAFPPAMKTELEPHAPLAEALAHGGGSSARELLGTTAAITTDDALAAELARTCNCYAENLEGLPIALACEAAAAPFAAVLACTNEVGSRGRAQWLLHKETAARAAAEAILTWLSRGAPGLPARAR